MNKATYNLLRKCQKYGLKRVCVGVAHPLVPESMTFPWNPDGSVFGIDTPKGLSKDDDGWPAIWRVVEDLGISWGAGNSNQHQARMDGLQLGAYLYRNKKWKKIYG